MVARAKKRINRALSGWDGDVVEFCFQTTSGGKGALDEFHSSMRKLQTAALIARLPRDAVERYAVLGQAVRWSQPDGVGAKCRSRDGRGHRRTLGRSGAGGRTGDRGYRVAPRAGPNLALASRKEAGRGTPRQLHLKGDSEHREAVA
jgi:hypothetical protein